MGSFSVNTRQEPHFATNGHLCVRVSMVSHSATEAYPSILTTCGSVFSMIKKKTNKKPEQQKKSKPQPQTKTQTIRGLENKTTLKGLCKCKVKYKTNFSICEAVLSFTHPA